MRTVSIRTVVRHGFIAAARLALVSFASLAGAQGSAPAAGAPSALGRLEVLHSATECEVWRREFSFAQSVEAHDAGSEPAPNPQRSSSARVTSMPPNRAAAML